MILNDLHMFVPLFKDIITVHFSSHLKLFAFVSVGSSILVFLDRPITYEPSVLASFATMSAIRDGPLLP